VIGALTSSIGKIARHFVRGRQEDSHEYIRSLLDLMHVGWLKERFGEDAEKVLDPRTQETTLVYHIFGGYTCGRVICSACGHESRTYQSALDFPIEVAAGRGQAVSSVAAAMRRNFVDTETLDGANKYKCGGCRSYVKAERGSKIHVSPNVLVVPVKRYQLGRAGKITKFVEYPKTLDLEPYMSSDAPYERSAPTYDLYGVVVHLDFMGSAHSGHYVAFVKLANGAWCKCDDGAVTKTTEATALKQKAYLLFYERRAPRGAPPTRTPAQQARKETLEAAEAARQKRVRQRREAMRGDANGAKAKDETGTKLLTPEYDVKTSGAQKKSARDDDDDDDASADVSEDSEEDSSEEETFSRSRLRASPWPAKVTVTVKLPTVASASALRVEMTDATVSVSTRRDAKRKQEKSVSAEKHVFLEVLLPFPVDDDDAGVVFDSRARTLAIVAPVRPYSARLARAHAAFLRRARREAREKTTETSRRRKNGAETLGASRRDGDSDSDSDSEWVETDGEAQQGSASEGEADEARGLAEGMGMMGLAASPNTRARRARVA
jgi:ubiquitin carboxyl-terminal hydrolase 36/42